MYKTTPAGPDIRSGAPEFQRRVPSLAMSPEFRIRPSSSLSLFAFPSLRTRARFLSYKCVLACPRRAASRSARSPSCFSSLLWRRPWAPTPRPEGAVCPTLPRRAVDGRIRVLSRLRSVSCCCWRASSLAQLLFWSGQPCCSEVRFFFFALSPDLADSSRCTVLVLRYRICLPSRMRSQFQPCGVLHPYTGLRVKQREHAAQALGTGTRP